MSNEEYHASSAVGSSSLKHMLRSPAHYREKLMHRPAATAAMDLGTAVHEAILEPELFLANAIVMPKFEGNGARARKDQWLTVNHGKRPLKLDDFEMIQVILENLRSNKLAMKLLSGGKAEESYFWQDQESGIVCKCRPDYLREGHVIVDIKTTIDASHDGFPTQVARLNYHLSAALYLDGVSAVLNKNFDQFLILAIEKDPPYAMNIHLLDTGTIDAGRMLYKRCLKRLMECRKSNTYPAYDQKVVTTSLPNWAIPFEEIESI